MSGPIVVSPDELRAAGAAVSQVATSTEELRGELNGDCSTQSACGDATVAAAFADFQIAMSEEIDGLHTGARATSQKAFAAAGTYVWSDRSVIPGITAP